MSADAVIIGNITGDPELNVSPTGKSYVNFGVAYTPIKPDGSKGEVNFYNITAWTWLAENFATSFKKGDRVIVLARLRQDRWEQDGQKRNKYTFTAESIGADIRYATVEVTKNVMNKTNGAEPEAPELTDDDLFAN